jgi:hypothetical protein
MQRKRPDGVVIHWIVYVPKTNELPFLIHWNELDQILPNIIKQAKLGIEGIGNITIAVKDIEKTINLYTLILDMKPKKTNITDIPNTKAVKFQLSKNQTITLISPKNSKTPLYNFIKENHSSPYSITLISTKYKKRIKLPEDKLNNTNLYIE